MIAVYVDKEVKKYKNEIKFSLDFIFNTLGYEYKFIKHPGQLGDYDILIFYSNNTPSINEAEYLAYDKIMLTLPIDKKLIDTGKLTKNEIVEFTRKINFVKKIPVIAETEFENPIEYFTTKHLNYIIFNFDFIGNIYFHLSHYEDITNYFFKNQRIIQDSNSSFLQYCNYPFVNALLFIFENTIIEQVEKQKSFTLVKKELWPEAQNYSVAIAHTVDSLQKWNFAKLCKSFLDDLLVFYKFKYVWNNFWSKLKYILTNIEEYWNFSIIREIEEVHNITSTFFWGKNLKNEKVYDYRMSDEDIREEILIQLKNNYDVGILAYQKKSINNALKKQKKELEKILKQQVWGVLNKDFYYELLKTPELYTQQFVYDSTLSLKEFNGFKSGIAYPYYNLYYRTKENDDKLEVSRSSCLELPLGLKSNHFIYSKFNNMVQSEALKEVNDKIQAVKKFNGMLAVDFNIAGFAEIDYLEEIYEFMLKKIKRDNAYVGNMFEIASWWNKRNSVKIRYMKNGVMLQFPERFEHFTVSLYGSKNIKKIYNSKYKINNEKIHFQNIIKDSNIIIQFDT